MNFTEQRVILKNQTPCILRSPQKEDAAKGLAYFKAVCGQIPYLLRYPEEVSITVQEEETLFEHFSRSPQTLMLLAFIDGEIASMASFSANSLIKTRHRASLAISVDQKFWGLGLGTHMINHLCQKAKEIGIIQMELEYIEGNKGARALYEKCGFIQYGQHPKAIRLKNGKFLDEILMLKDLTL